MDVTLITVPLYKIRSHVFVASDDVLVNGEAISWAKTSDQLTFYWFPSISEVVVSNFSFVSAETVGNAKSFMSTTFESNVLNTIYKESAFNLSTSECTEESTLGMIRKTSHTKYLRCSNAKKNLGNKMLHFLEMRSRTALSPLTVGLKPLYTYDQRDPSVGYPHDMFSAICGEENTVSACAWSHPRPYSIETMESE